MWRVFQWRSWVLVLIGILLSNGVLMAQTGGQDSGGSDGAENTPAAVLDQASPGQGPITAVGTLSLVQRHQIALSVGGEISAIHVKVGDRLKKGDLLISLDTTQLGIAVERFELALNSAKLMLDKLKSTTDESAVSLAEANLLAAQANLALVEAGPTPDELKAAESRASAAWSTYTSVKDGPSQAQLKQLSANLRKAEIAVLLAQREYDSVSWQPNVGASAAAAALQNATIDLEAAQGAYEEATAVSAAALASALSAALDANLALSALQAKPTPAELASAQAAVVGAEAALAAAQRSPAIDIQLEEIRVKQAEIDLIEARAALANGRVVAPIDGTVLAVWLEQGDVGSAGTLAATMADTSALDLIVNVEQKYINRIQIGQKVEVSVFAIPDLPAVGVVDQIAPVGEALTNVIVFPVTIRLELAGDGLESYRAGMTATANFLEE